jgi:predicted DCC family thiol-disulfide oxidoreductase YuxK
MRIIFFDGECLLCHSFIQFLWKRDIHRTLNYAPLQGETAKRALPETLRKNLNTVVYLDEDKISEKSEAVANVLCQLEGIYKLIGILIKLSPQFIRNFVYDVVAKNRHKWFGGTKNCLFIKEADQKYFLN